MNPPPLRIALGADHAGFHLKQALAQHLKDEGHRVDDLGCHTEERCDYPDLGAAVGRAVTIGAADFGVCVCGTGIGISIAANKVTGVRAALAHDADTARLAREHNDANVLCLGARVLDEREATEAVDAFLHAQFEGGRHAGRLQKISQLEVAR